MKKKAGCFEGQGLAATHSRHTQQARGSKAGEVSLRATEFPAAPATSASGDPWSRMKHGSEAMWVPHLWKGENLGTPI